MMTLLEDLPNEILMDVFEYISPRDLFYSFWTLNMRINQLLRSLKNLSLLLYNDEQLLIQTFADKVFHLEVSKQYGDVDMHQFFNLRSLILHQANDKQLDQIQHEFMPNLVTLCISKSSITAASDALTNRIFSNQLSALRDVNLGFLSLPKSSTWSISSSLHSLCIHCDKARLVPMILMTCPNLKRFQLNILAGDQSAMFVPPMPFNHGLKHFMLSIGFHLSPSEILQNILLCIPNVKIVYLQCYCDTPLIVFLRMIAERLKYLTRFDCNIRRVSNVIEDDNLDNFRRIHPCFNRLQCTLTIQGYHLFTVDRFLRKAHIFG